MDLFILSVFLIVYLGMILGEIPGLALDRTGVALLGAIGVVAVGRGTLGGAWSGVDMPTLHLLFAMMVISAQFRLAGFYTQVSRRMVAADVAPAPLLAVFVGPTRPLTAAPPHCILLPW